MARSKVLLRTSERATYKRCRQKWDWAFNQRLRPRTSANALRFGSLIHEALAAYYIPGRKRGPHPAKTFKKLYQAELKTASSFGMRDVDDEWIEAGTLGDVMLNEYIDFYGNDAHLEIISPEMPFEIDVSDKNGKYLVTYVGTFDAVMKDLRTKQIGLFEHKTAKAISTDHLPLDEQAGSYWCFAPDWLKAQGILKPKQDLDFILYNFLRKGMPDVRPKNDLGQRLNKDGSVSKVQPLPLFHREVVYRDEADRATMLQRVRMEAWEMRLVRAGKLPIYKTPTMGCSWDCAFFDMCELHETGADWEESRRQIMTTWDPYEDHRDNLESLRRAAGKE